MARKDSWFKFEINRWKASTRRLSPGARGLYADLIVEWRDGGSVPDDLREIAALFGHRDYRSVRAPLDELKQRGKVRVDADGFLYNVSVEDDIAAREAQRRAKDEERGGGGSAPPVAQPRLPLGPVLVHDNGDKSGRTRGRSHEIADSSARDPRLSRDCSASPARKPLIGNETRAPSENPEWRDSQSVVEAPSPGSARARAGPGSA